MCIDAAADGEAAIVEEAIYALNDTVVYRPKLAVVELVEDWAFNPGFSTRRKK